MKWLQILMITMKKTGKELRKTALEREQNFKVTKKEAPKWVILKFWPKESQERVEGKRRPKQKIKIT